MSPSIEGKKTKGGIEGRGLKAKSMKRIQVKLTIRSSQFLAFCWDVGAVVGAMLIIYGFFVAFGVPPYAPLDYFIELLSAPVTILGATAVFLSIYLKPSITPVKWQSQFIISPLFICACIVAGYLYFDRTVPSPNSILVGLSICAIFGSLMRIVPRIHEVTILDVLEK